MLNKKETMLETEKQLNSKILEITMMIKDRYPELSNYLAEMSVTIPDEKNPIITPESLKKYYDSLHSMLTNYIAEHSICTKKEQSITVDYLLLNLNV